jgi:hypothetical protein
MWRDQNSSDPCALGQSARRSSSHAGKDLVGTEAPASSGGRRQRAGYELPSDLRYRIGQMIMVGFRGMNAVEAAPTMRNIAAGNIGAAVACDVDAETGGPRNIQSREQIHELVADVKGASEIPVLVMADAEGGFHHRLKEKYGFGPAIREAEMGERNDLGFTHSAAGAIASMLAEVGIDSPFRSRRPPAGPPGNLQWRTRSRSGVPRRGVASPRS